MENTIHSHLATAFNLLSSIPVCEDNVEKMAMAKQELRKAYELAKKLEQAPTGEIAQALEEN